MPPSNTSVTTTADYSPLEYRIAIADECGCPNFRNLVLQSNSNTNAAIYFRKQHLQQIAAAVGTTPPETATSGEIRQSIRASITDAQSPSPHVDTPAASPALATDGGLSNVTSTNSSQNRFNCEELAELASLIGTTPDPPYIESDLRRLAGSSIAGPYLASLIKHAHVDAYLSVNVGSPTAERGSRAFYPFRLEPVHEIPDTATSHPDCHRYIVDSSIQHDEYDNEDALEAAHRVDADAVILADEWHDMDGTIEAIIDGIEHVNTHAFSGDVILPLQPPHDLCLKHLLDRGVSTTHTFALGGLKDTNDDHTKINAARAVRDVAPSELTLHGLGFGITNTMASAIRETPALLDSLDYSTPAQNAIGDAMPGEERLCTVAAQTGAAFIEDLRKISTLVNDESETQQTFGSFV